jgi:hypothetical protein
MTNDFKGRFWLKQKFVMYETMIKKANDILESAKKESKKSMNAVCTGILSRSVCWAWNEFMCVFGCEFGCEIYFKMIICTKTCHYL